MKKADELKNEAKDMREKIAVIIDEFIEKNGYCEIGIDIEYTYREHIEKPIKIDVNVNLNL